MEDGREGKGVYERTWGEDLFHWLTVDQCLRCRYFTDLGFKRALFADAGRKKHHGVGVTKTMLLSGRNFDPLVRLAVVDPLAKFKECSFIHSRNIGE